MLLLPFATANAQHTPEQIEFFETNIRPILAQECYECHSTAHKIKSGLNLALRDGLKLDT